MNTCLFQTQKLVKIRFSLDRLHCSLLYKCTLKVYIVESITSYFFVLDIFGSWLAVGVEGAELYTSFGIISFAKSVIAIKLAFILGVRLPCCNLKEKNRALL